MPVLHLVVRLSTGVLMLEQRFLLFVYFIFEPYIPGIDWFTCAFLPGTSNTLLLYVTLISGVVGADCYLGH